MRDWWLILVGYDYLLFVIIVYVISLVEYYIVLSKRKVYFYYYEFLFGVNRDFNILRYFI